jgi:fructose-1,6-bisphosphatase
MKAFANLIKELDTTTKTTLKVSALTSYFQNASDEMDITPTELHQRIPFFCGSKNMVEKAEEFMAKYGQ